MIVWIEAGENPALLFYPQIAPELAGLPSIRHNTLIAVSPLRSALSVTGGADAANMSITVENSQGQMTDIISRLIGQKINIFRLADDSALLFFSGVAQSADIAEQIELRIVA